LLVPIQWSLSNCSYFFDCSRIAFSRPVELAKAEVAVNLYTCNVSTPREAIVRVWFSAKIYETQIRLGAKNGNKGAMPIAGSLWVKVDLRKVVDLAAPKA
jgi:hypothetical protein